MGCRSTLLLLLYFQDFINIQVGFGFFFLTMNSLSVSIRMYQGNLTLHMLQSTFAALAGIMVVVVIVKALDNFRPNDTLLETDAKTKKKEDCKFVKNLTKLLRTTYTWECKDDRQF